MITMHGSGDWDNWECLRRAEMTGMIGMTNNDWDN